MRTNITLLATILAARLCAQMGSIDTQFNPQDILGGNGDGFRNEAMGDLLLESDSTILIHGAGGEKFYNGLPCPNLIRIALHGERDTSFPQGTGFDWSVTAVAVQADGRILVGGQFGSYNGTPVPAIVRLLTDGQLDPSFQLEIPVSAYLVTDICPLPDGTIMVGVGMSPGGGYWLARLDGNGSWDSSFSGSVNALPLLNGPIHNIHTTDDEQLIITGSFNQYDGENAGFIARINADGSLDPSFGLASGFNGPVFDSHVSTNGRITAVGQFTAYDGAPISRLAQLLPSGALVSTFGVPNTPQNPLPFGGITPLEPGGFLVHTGYGQLYGGITVNGLFKVSALGVLDSGFGPVGTFDGCFDGVELPNNDIVIVGSMNRFFGPHMVHQGGILRVSKDGELDLNFNRNTGADESVESIVPTSDGGAYIGGAFTRYNGRLRNGIARIAADGTLMPDLEGHGIGPLYPSDRITVKEIVPLPDGKILIGGYFNRYDGVLRNSVARLLSDGTLDPSFIPGISTSYGGVNAMVPAANGKVLVGGMNLAGLVYGGGVKRLLPNGALDLTYHNGISGGHTIEALCAMPSGHVLVGGSQLALFDGIPCTPLLKLDENGFRDLSFQANVQPANNQQTAILAIARRADGKIAVAGDFGLMNGQERKCIAVLDEDGQLDPLFDPGTGFNNDVDDVKWMPDGRLVAIGSFTEYNGAPCAGIARLNADGSLDATLEVGDGQFHYFGWNDLNMGAIGVLADNSILLGGQFTSCGSVARSRILKLVENTWTSVHTRTESSPVSIYPNPTTGPVTIKALPAGTHSIALYDLAGKLISEQPMPDRSDTSISLDISDQVPGTYLMEVLHLRGSSTHLLHKVR
jgi:uncharacterized delta-60 repeat protein